MRWSQLLDNMSKDAVALQKAVTQLRALVVSEEASGLIANIEAGLGDILASHGHLRGEVASMEGPASSAGSASALPAGRQERVAIASSVEVGVQAVQSELASVIREGRRVTTGNAGDMPNEALEQIERMRRGIDRLDNQLNAWRDASARNAQQAASELRGRIEILEEKYDALLNGRIFRTLGKLGNAARRLRLIQKKGAAPVGKAIPAPAVQPAGDHVVPVASAGAPAQVTTETAPEKLPVPANVRIAGVSYMSRPAGGVRADSIVHEGTPLVSVVMTSFNTGKYIDAAVQSILGQSWKNLELIIVDDCSSDDTRERLERFAQKDSRVKLYCFGENRGTYWCKNFGITKSSGVAVTFMDSDDTSEPTRIEEQFAALNVAGCVVSTCNHVRKDEDGKTIAINGVVERVAYISQMVKREVFEEIGYFDTVRTSADDEFLRRIRITYGLNAQTNVKKVLYIALLREGSLTSDPANAINFVQERNAGKSFLSPQRRHYAAMCERWHEFLKEKGLRPYVPFPVVRRPFPVYGRLVVSDGKYDGNYITACVASYPPREEKLERVIASLLPQVDEIHVYLNQYESMPSFLKHSRIKVVLGGEQKNLRDNGKFYFTSGVRDGYCFTVDDDINYPADYVSTLIRKVEFYERQAIVGLHGTIYSKPIRSFFRGRTLLHFEEALEKDTIVNQLGTGTVAFHTALIRPELKWFEATGMADVWLAANAKRMNIPMIAIERAALWASPIGVEETTLFREFRKNDGKQTEIVKSVAPWKEVLRGPLAASVREKSRLYGNAYDRLLPREGVA